MTLVYIKLWRSQKGQAHTNTQKLNRDISTVIFVLRYFPFHVVFKLWRGFRSSSLRMKQGSQVQLLVQVSIFLIYFLNLGITEERIYIGQINLNIVTCMVKIMLKRRKESNIYLAADKRHRWSMQIAMKVDKKCSFQLALRPLSAEEEDWPRC